MNDKKNPAICIASDSEMSELFILNIIKYLINNGADINVQDGFTRSPLTLATRKTSVEIVSYLLSNGANLFLKYCNANNGQQETALCIAYINYIAAKRSGREDVSFVKKKICLDIVLQAVANHLYLNGLYKNDPVTYVSNAIENLCGNFTREWSNSSELKIFLDEEIKPVVLTQIEASCTFLKGSKSVNSTLYNFFHSDGSRSVTQEIFSFVMPTLKN